MVAITPSQMFGAPERDLESSWRHATIVFTGIVLSYEDKGDSRYYEFQVLDVEKSPGHIPGVINVKSVTPDAYEPHDEDPVWGNKHVARLFFFDSETQRDHWHASYVSEMITRHCNDSEHVVVRLARIDSPLVCVTPDTAQRLSERDILVDRFITAEPLLEIPDPWPNTAPGIHEPEPKPGPEPESISEANSKDERDDLKEVVYSNTNCSKYWRGELFEMWNGVNHDYKNDPIFIECSDALTSQRHLESLEFDKWDGDGDVHYDKIDSDKKYWATLKDIKLDDNDESIKVTFSDNGFETRWTATGQQEKTYSVPDFRYVTTIHKDQEFVALCTDTDERRIHVLKYDGITEKDGIDYYTFWHKSTTIPIEDLPKCQYPTIIHDSKNIDFDLGDKPTSEVWDHDWE